jgi:AcrR family transcriptional regulator
MAALKNAAREQLVSKGISGTSVQPILDRAGVSRGALFHHFPTKNHLIAAAFDDLMQNAATRLSVLGNELRLSLIDLEAFVAGVRATFCSDLFIGSMEVALNNRIEPGMNDLIQDSVARWWSQLRSFWTETFELPGRSPAEADQHWVMAANLLRGHAFTTIYRSSEAIKADFCASFRQMILSDARIRPLEDSFDRLNADLREAVSFKLFTALAVKRPYVERVYTNHAELFPLTGRKRLDASPWGAHVIERGDSWLGHDADDMMRMFPDYALIARLGCASCINIPVVVKGQTIGSLNMLDAAHAYTREDVTKAALFAPRAALLFDQTNRLP